MKNLTLTFLFLGLFSGLSAQYVTIPDVNFRRELVRLYPGCFNASQQMDTTCSEVVNATYLYLHNRQIINLNGVQYFDGLDTLDCSANQLTNLPTLPSGLQYLECYFNQLTRLPSLPITLTILGCRNNQLTNLPAMPNSLISVSCENNRLTSLPTLPSSLEWLGCSGNQLTSLPVLPSGFVNFDCSNNLLTSLPALPSGLLYLYCNNNQLTSLPVLPSGLAYLMCYDNQLTILPVLPDSLSYLWCNNNQLSTLPVLPSRLGSLYCDNNPLMSLPNLPSNLGQLGCSGNQLTRLPSLPSRLTHLICANNQLTSLPELPSGLRHFRCNDNPNLACLPFLPNTLNGFGSFNVTGTAITCLPNYSHWAQMLSRLPLCTNPNQICQTNPIASGVVYIDANNNGVRDSLERLVGGIPIFVNPNNWTGVSDTTNSYLVKLDILPITNVITPGQAYPYRIFSPSSYSVTSDSLGLLPTSYDFAMQIAQPNITDLVTRISTWFIRPGFQTSASVIVENLGTIDQTNVRVSLEIPNGLTVISTLPANGVVTGNTVTWSGESIAILERKSYSVSLQVPTTMPLGTSLTYTAIALPSGNDFTADNNYVQERVVVTGSYDPNDKQVNKDRLPNNYVAADEEMLYTIRFQNTGTDTAFTVLIRDTLDLQKLDFSTFRVTGASHALRTNVRDHGVLEFVFNNILLPDSFVNEPMSHGYVQFRIHPKANLPLGTQIKNRAFIYFDFNTPIITNFATTTVGLLSVSSAALGAGSLSLYPVPMSEQLTVNFNAVRSGEVRYRLLDLQGRLLQEQQLTITEGENISTMDMSQLGAGMYILQVVGEQGSLSQKVIKE